MRLNVTLIYINARAKTRRMFALLGFHNIMDAHTHVYAQVTCVCIMALSTLRELPRSRRVLRQRALTSTAQNWGWDRIH